MISELFLFLPFVILCAVITFFLGRYDEQEDCPGWVGGVFVLMLGQTITMIGAFIYGCIKTIIQ